MKLQYAGDASPASAGQVGGKTPNRRLLLRPARGAAHRGPQDRRPRRSPLRRPVAPVPDRADLHHQKALKKKREPPAGRLLFFSSRRSVRGYFAPRRERFLCLRRPHFFQQRKKWGKERRQKLRFCTSSARYTALVCKAAPPRNRHFLTRCRSADCASTAFRCRCPLLRQKTFVLLRRRLRNNYIRAQRAHLPLPPQGGKGAI